MYPDPVILYEDDDVLAINKPAGLAVHADGRTERETLVDWILKHYPEMKEVGEPTTLADGRVINRPGIVHRLDRETSGVLLLAKNQKSFKHLKKQFHDRLIRKEYHVFVYGKVSKDFGTIDRPIGRSRTDFRRWSAEPKARGELRSAETYYEVLRRGEGATFLKVIPKTGRTHQIRVHFKAIGYPVVSDSLYAPSRPKLLGFSRLALHAYALEYEGLKGDPVVITAPYPGDFTQALAELEAW